MVNINRLPGGVHGETFFRAEPLTTEAVHEVLERNKRLGIGLTAHNSRHVSAWHISHLSNKHRNHATSLKLDRSACYTDVLI